LTDKEAVQQFEARIKSERKEQNDKVKIIFKLTNPSQLKLSCHRCRML